MKKGKKWGGRETETKKEKKDKKKGKTEKEQRKKRGKIYKSNLVELLVLMKTKAWSF